MQRSSPEGVTEDLQFGMSSFRHEAEAWVKERLVPDGSDASTQANSSDGDGLFADVRELLEEFKANIKKIATITEAALSGKLGARKQNLKTAVINNGQ